MDTERKQILEIGIRNPIVNAAIQYWRMGDCTFEQAMMRAVIMLEQQNEKLTQVINKEIQNR